MRMSKKAILEVASHKDHVSTCTDTLSLYLYISVLVWLLLFLFCFPSIPSSVCSMQSKSHLLGPNKSDKKLMRYMLFTWSKMFPSLYTHITKGKKVILQWRSLADSTSISWIKLTVPGIGQVKITFHLIGCNENTASLMWCSCQRWVPCI